MKKGTIQFLRWVFLVIAGYQAIDIAGSLARFFYHANQPDVVLGAGVATFFVLVTIKTIAGLVAFGISIWLKKLYHKMKSEPLADSTIAVALEKSMVDRGLVDLQAEERIYDKVRQELDSGAIRSGLWTKAEATASSADKATVRARYIKLRFDQLSAEVNLTNQLAEEEDPQSSHDKDPEPEPKVESSIEQKPLETNTQQKPDNFNFFYLVVLAFVMFMIIASALIY